MIGINIPSIEDLKGIHIEGYQKGDSVNTRPVIKWKKGYLN
jgi:hypothetical protein